MMPTVCLIHMKAQRSFHLSADELASRNTFAAVEHTLARCKKVWLRWVQVWLKPSSEMSFLYGNHVLKSGLAKITENTPTNAGIVIFSLSDIPLGFGVTAKSTSECRSAEPGTIVALHQADVGEYLRSEDDLL